MMFFIIFVCLKIKRFKYLFNRNCGLVHVFLCFSDIFINFCHNLFLPIYFLLLLFNNVVRSKHSIKNFLGLHKKQYFLSLRPCFHYIIFVIFYCSIIIALAAIPRPRVRKPYFLIFRETLNP
jgi:hypothetical protein